MAIYHFRPIEVLVSRRRGRRRHKAATAAGGRGQGAWKPRAEGNVEAKGDGDGDGNGAGQVSGEDTKQQGCQNTQKRLSRAQKERRASSSKTLA